MKKGFIAISTVLVLMSVIIAIVLTITYLAVGEGQSSLAIYLGEDNLNLVEGCAEDYMLKIRSDSSFTGGNITRPEGTCTITINSGNPNWDITISSTNVDYKRKVQVKFVRNPTGITLTSWQEI